MSTPPLLQSPLAESAPPECSRNDAWREGGVNQGEIGVCDSLIGGITYGAVRHRVPLSRVQPAVEEERQNRRQSVSERRQRIQMDGADCLGVEEFWKRLVGVNQRTNPLLSVKRTLHSSRQRFDG